MAPSKPSVKGPEVSSTPLADFFWIAGLDSQDILETYQKLGEVANFNNSQALPVGETIEEDEDAEAEASSVVESSRPTSRSSKRNSFQRLSKLSNEARLSIKSIDSGRNGTNSNRSSGTIKPVHPSGVPSLLNEADFEKALQRFATERDSFFLDLNLNRVPTSASSRPKPRPKTQKIVADELSPGLKSGIGSVRRHMSFKEMSSLKRQPSLARQASVRTSRRMSNYNSVIPSPQPLTPSPTQHPLKRTFEPVLLDRYPQKGMPDESKRRVSFPDYVPMFAFPDDIHIVSADSRPRSTWHGFTMTAADNSKLHAICVIVWIPLNQRAAEELEKRCEEWRRDNMADVDRELAASLGERLALERAKLSQLLSKLPTISSGSEARDDLEDEISAVEEKIQLMTDMLRPVRHGAASKIEGLTDGDTGLWIPRAYGILGRDGALTSFWKEWLRAVVVPMTDGGVLRVPPSSPKVGMWQPLERYVINLCTEAPSPYSSKTQVEIAIRELRLFARKEAVNELPGSRNTDLYALFRALSIPNIIVLFEYVLAESRIILLSSHTSMLYLVTKAITELLFPLKWAGIMIPVLPARLIQALEAPVPYICGIERRYEKVELPEDDFVLVDLDQDEIESTSQPLPLPRQQRRKLMSLLQLAAPHHYKFGVKPGPPSHAVETFPFDAFASETPSVFSPHAQSTSLAKLVSLNSTSFGTSTAAETRPRAQIFNAFLQAKGNNSRGADRPGTSSTARTSVPGSPHESPTNGSFPPLPVTPVSRNDSGYALQSSLREKRSGHFDSASKRSSSFGNQPNRRPSLPFAGHSSNLSIATLNPELQGSTYAPSTYAQSTIAASTIMPQTIMQPVRNTETTMWVEGHCLQWRAHDGRSTCAICDEKADDGTYRCSGCGTTVHARCGSQIVLICPAAFHPEQIRAAFVRCFASLFYTYRKFLRPASGEQKKSGMIYRFAMEDFLRSLPHENADYVSVLQQTQAFNEFVHERCTTAPASNPIASPSLATQIALFDSIILAKRGRTARIPSMFSSRSQPTDFVSDTSEHLWRSAAATPFGANRGVNLPHDKEYRATITRTPAKLDPTLMKEPRMIQGVPSVPRGGREGRRKPLPKMMNGLALSPP